MTPACPCGRAGGSSSPGQPPPRRGGAPESNAAPRDGDGEAPQGGERSPAPPTHPSPPLIPTPSPFRGGLRPLCKLTVTWRGLVGVGRESPSLVGGWVCFFKGISVGNGTFCCLKGRFDALNPPPPPPQKKFQLVPGASPKQRRGTGGTKPNFKPNSLEFLGVKEQNPPGCRRGERGFPKRRGWKAEPCQGGASRS